MKLQILILLLFISVLGYPQESTTFCVFDSSNTNLKLITSSIDTNGWIFFEDYNILQEGDVFESDILNIPNDNEMVEFEEKTSWIEGEEFKTIKYKQKYKDIPVECGTLIEHWKNCTLKSINGKFVCGINADTSSLISTDDAIQLALLDLPATLYFWEDSLTEATLQNEFENSDTSYYPKPIKMVNCLKEIIYRMDINALEPSFSYQIDVNATSGAIESTKENKVSCLPTENASIPNLDILPPTDFTTYSKLFYDNSIKVPLKTTYTWGKHRLIANFYSSKIESRDLDEQLNDIHPWDDCIEHTMDGVLYLNWSNSINKTTQAHWAVVNAMKYFNESLGWYPLAGKGTLKVRARGAFKGAFALLDNNGISFGRLGAGLGSVPNYTAVPDIAGHELMHLAIRSIKGSLFTFGAEGDALEESFGDIIGAMVEEYTLGTFDWNIGELSNCIIRNISNPPSIPPLTSCVSPGAACGATGGCDTYQGLNWVDPISFCDFGGIHINCGVHNKWFAMLADGGMHNNVSVNGIGKDKALKIALRNLRHYLTEKTSFVDARNGAIQAAIDLYGECSTEFNMTELAWQAVGLGEATNCLNETGETYICQNEKNLPLSITVQNTSGVDLTWEPVKFDFVQWIYDIHTDTNPWTYEISGVNNNTITITDIPDNTDIEWPYLFKYSDGITERYLDFTVYDCPGLISDPPPSVSDCDLVSGNRSGVLFSNEITKLNMHPNPASGILHISNFLNFKYEIFSTSGRQISNGSTIDGSINIESLENGYYILKVENKEGKIIKQGFIKI